MDGKIEHHVCIKFCVKLNKSSMETTEMPREAFFKPDSVLEWHSCFKADQVSVEDDKRSGRPSTSKTTEDVEKIRELIHKDRH
jgi:hypothetical protein